MVVEDIVFAEGRLHSAQYSIRWNGGAATYLSGAKWKFGPVCRTHTVEVMNGIDELEVKVGPC